MSSTTTATTLPTRRSIEEKIQVIQSFFHDPKRKNAIPNEWGEFIRGFSEHVTRRVPHTSGSASAQQKQNQNHTDPSSSSAASTSATPTSTTTFDPMVTLITVMEQNLLKNQSKEVRKFGLGLIRDTVVIPAPPPAPRFQAPPPSAASRTLRLPPAPMAKIVNALLPLFHDNDDSVRSSALEALKFYMQVDNEVVYCHMEDITLQTLMVLPLGQDKRNAPLSDFLTSLVEILRNQMRSQRTDQGTDRGETLPPVFSMSRFVSLVVRGLNLAAERRSDSVCAALTGKFLGLIDGSEDANILQDFHRLIGPLLELVKYRETANPAHAYLIQQQRAVEAWVQSHVLYEPVSTKPNTGEAQPYWATHSHQTATNTNTSTSAPPSVRNNAAAETGTSTAAASRGASATPRANENNNDNKENDDNDESEQQKQLGASSSSSSSTIVGFNRVAALDAVIERFETLRQGTCSAYSHALSTFLNWLVLLLTFRVPPGGGLEPQIPHQCGSQVPRILAQILPLDDNKCQTLHERLEIVFRKWPNDAETSGQILEACLRTFDDPQRRGVTLLKWVGHVVALCYDVANEKRDDINRALMECMNEKKEVHTLALQLMCRLAKQEKSLWERFIAGIVASMSDFRARIPTCFCMLQQFSAEVGFEPSFVIVASAKYVQKLNDKAFRAAMVKTLSLLICTAVEFDPLRKLLREGTKSNPQAKKTFDSVFPCWCFNASWSVGLCLLTREFELANALVEEIGSGDVSAFVLEQLHRVIQLFESPTFAFARIALLKPRENPFLIRALFGVLMLLPQESSSFALLNKRLECVSQQQQALSSNANIAGDSASPNQHIVKEKIDVFQKVQAELMVHEITSSTTTTM